MKNELTELSDELDKKRDGSILGISREEGEALFTFIRTHNVRRVVETGICFGFTSAYILAALPKDGHLISIEPATNDFIGKAVPERLRKNWTIVSGFSHVFLRETFRRAKNIDMFFHDSDHGYLAQMFEYQTALQSVDFIGSHDIALMGPPFAWDDFVKAQNIQVIFQIGQMAVGSTKLMEDK